MKLPLLVRFLVLFQVSSNLALLLIWAFLSLKECMILLDAHTQQKQNSSPEPHAVQQRKRLRRRRDVKFSELRDRIVMDIIGSIKGLVRVDNIDGVGGKVDEAGGS